MNEQRVMKKVMIATPCHDRKLPVEYVSSLLDTMRADCGIIVAPVFLPGESMLPHARNYLAKIFLESTFDSIFYIDADMTWNKDDFIRLALSDKKVISGIARLKKDNAPFNFIELNGEKVNDDGLLKIESIGCAFIKIDREVMEDISNSSTKYKMNNEEYKSIFEYSKKRDEFVGEDITFCRKITKKKYPIYADVNAIIGHIGNKIY